MENPVTLHWLYLVVFVPVRRKLKILELYFLNLCGFLALYFLCSVPKIVFLVLCDSILTTLESHLSHYYEGINISV